MSGWVDRLFENQAQCRCGRVVSVITTYKGWEMCLMCYADCVANEKRVRDEADGDERRDD